MTESSTRTTGASARNTDVDVRQLLAEYVGICNRAMAQNSDDFLIRQARRISGVMAGEARCRTLVYDGEPDNVIEEAYIRFDPAQRQLHLDNFGSDDVAFTWKVPLDYLADVVHTRPDWYAENPVMLDWKWFTERAGDALRHAGRDRKLVAAGVAGFIVGGFVTLAVNRARARG